MRNQRSDSERSFEEIRAIHATDSDRNQCNYEAINDNQENVLTRTNA